MEMVGIMAQPGFREQALKLLTDARTHADVSLMDDTLSRLKELLLVGDPSLLPEFLPHLLKLQAERAAFLRNFIYELIEEMGCKHLEHIPTMVPVLLNLMRDDKSAVVRHAVSIGSILFRVAFEQVAIQGIFSGCVDKRLEDAWIWINNIKAAICLAAQEHKRVAFLAIKFVETMILLFTPDPNQPSQLPSMLRDSDGWLFNVTWLAGRHPFIDVETLGEEANRNLTMLLGQFQAPAISSIPGPVALVLVNSLASIAKRRPLLYGRILPVLLSLGPSCEDIKGAQLASIIHALKNAFLNLLKCTHAGAESWRERIVAALREMNAGDVADAAVRQIERTLRNAERERAFRGSFSQVKEFERKRPLQENGTLPVDMDDTLAKRVHASSEAMLASSQEVMCSENSGSAHELHGLNIDSNLSPLQQMISVIGALVAKGARAEPSINVLIASLPADMFADVVIENMRNLPAVPPPITFGMPGLDSSTQAGSMGPPSVSEGMDPGQKTTDHQCDSHGEPHQLDLLHAAVHEVASDVQSAMRDEDFPVDAIPTASSRTEEMTLITDVGDLIPKPELPMKRMDLPAVIPPITCGLGMPGLDSSMKTGSVAPTSISEGMEPTKRNIDNWHDSHGGPHQLDPQYAVVHQVVSGVQFAMGDEDFRVDMVPISSSTTEEASFITDNVNLIQNPEVPNSSLLFDPPGILPEAILSKLPTLSMADGLATAPAVVQAEDNGQSVDVSLKNADVAEVADAGSPQMIPSLEANDEIQTADNVLSPVSGVRVRGLPFVHLDADEQAAIGKSILLRMLDNHWFLESAGMAELGLPLLARLVVQADADKEELDVLQNYIIADYHNHKGHEFTIHALYQLYVKIMDRQAANNNPEMASKIYEDFLVDMVHCLRDPVSPSDKSLSKLLVEVPVIPSRVLKLLEDICCPVASEGSREVEGDHISQGLKAVWSLILLRPPVRTECMDIVLKCTIHDHDEVRTKAIALVANKLFPLPYVSQTVEDFATQMLDMFVEKASVPSSIRHDEASDGLDTKTLSISDEKQCKGSKSMVSVQEAHRCMSLYFALCTKKPSLFHHILMIYQHAPKAVRQAIHRHIPVLIRMIGPSPDLMCMISGSPIGSKNLLLLILHVLVESSPPSAELVAAVKTLYGQRIKDARILIPILSSLSKDEVMPIFPQLVTLPSEDFKAALDRILQGSIQTGPALTPAEVLIAIHDIDPERDEIPLSTVKDACAICFQQQTVFTQQVLAKVLSQLVERTPLPMLFMRTVILAVGSFRSLVSFVMDILSRLISRQIWKWPNLWIGFLKCADQTQPHSFHVLLQLPAAQLEKALNKCPNLKAPLATYARQATVCSTLARSSLTVLGVAEDLSLCKPTSVSHSQPTPANATLANTRPASEVDVSESSSTIL